MFLLPPPQGEGWGGGLYSPCPNSVPARRDER